MSAALLFLAVLPAQTPAAAVAAAAADVRQLDAVTAQRARYLSLYHLSDPKALAEWDRVLSFWANSLSTEAELVRPVRVGPALWRVDLGNYGWRREVWEKLLEAPEPYFHVQVLAAPVVEYEEWGYFRGPGRTNWVTTERRPKKQQATKAVAASAPWLDAGQISALILATQSQVPIVRADWWLAQTAVAAGRKAGYYDFLNVGPKESDFQALVSADPKAVERLKLETAGIVGRSGVTLQNRSLHRQPTLTGAYWFSRDFVASTDRKNALRLLDRDAENDATEQQGSLPNGLWAYYLADAKGQRVDTAPDNIASDGRAAGTDRRVHVGLSCVRCHQGLHPIDDWARRVFAPPFSLDSVDFARQKRLRALYLSDLGGKLRADQERYAAVLLALTGQTPKRAAEAFASAWDSYVERDRDLSATAVELGLTPAAWTAKLRAAAAAKRSLDPVLAALAQGLSIRAEWWEEVYSQAQEIARTP